MKKHRTMYSEPDIILDASGTHPPLTLHLPLPVRSFSLALFRHLLTDEDGVECGAAQQLVSRDEHLKAFVAEDEALANPANFDVPLGSGVHWHGVEQLVGVVDHLHAFGSLED